MVDLKYKAYTCERSRLVSSLEGRINFDGAGHSRTATAAREMMKETKAGKFCTGLGGIRSGLD